MQLVIGEIVSQFYNYLQKDLLLRIITNQIIINNIAQTMIHYRHQQQTQIDSQTPVQQVQIDQIQQTQQSLGQYVVLFVIVTMFLGGIMKQVHKKTKIPYTPLLIILGVFFGYSKDILGEFGKTTAIIQQLNPNLILLVFIPTLLFQSAYNCDWYVFKKSLVNIIILAGPGLLWGAIMIGVCFKSILQYDDLSWYQSFTLGCILSATDPVAVVSLLKQLGASLRFNTLVEGESLMNDGASMVFFLVFRDLVKGNKFQPLDVGIKLVRISLGGPILGIVVGFATSYWLAKIVRDPLLSINLTFISAYLCFYLSEFTFLNVSGILAVVCLGLYMSASSKGKMFLATSSALHNAWGYIQYSCETCIFMITGIIIGIAMTQQSSISWLDWLRLIVFWILLIITRGIMVLTFYPLISNFGYGLDVKQMVVLIYGGLRGALGLCLALMVNFDDKLSSRFRQLTIFYTCGIAMMTIIINGLTCGNLVQFIGMIENSEIKAKMFKRSIQKILRKTQAGIEQLKELNLAKTKWQEAIVLSKARTLGGVNFDSRYEQLPINNIQQSFIVFQEDQALQQIRYRFTKYLKKYYHRSFHEGEMSQQTLYILVNSCNVVNDHLHDRINYFELMVANFNLSWLQKNNRLRRYPFIGKYVTQLLLKKMFKIYQTSLAFINSCEKGLKFFNVHYAATNSQTVQQEILQNMELAATFLVEIETNYESIVEAVQTTKIATMIIQRKSQALKQINQDGFIQENQYVELMKQIDKDALQAHSKQRQFAEFIIEEKLSQFPIFSRLSQQEQIELLAQGQQQKYLQNAIIVEKDSPIQRVFFINSGIVKEQFQSESYSMFRSVGCSVDPYDIIYNEKYRCNVIAQKQTKVTFFPVEKIRNLLETNEKFKMNWYRGLFRYILKGPFKKFHFNKIVTQNQHRLLLQISQMKIFKPQQHFCLFFGGYLFEGSLKTVKYSQQIEANCFIQAKKQFICKNRAIIMIFKDTQNSHLALTDQQQIESFNEIIRSPLKPKRSLTKLIK